MDSNTTQHPLPRNTQHVQYTVHTVHILIVTEGRLLN